MLGTYHYGHRLLQDQFDTRRLADRKEGRLVSDLIDSEDKAFIEEVDMFFLATADEQGCLNCSCKGGEPGFVRVLDDHTLRTLSYQEQQAPTPTNSFEATYPLFTRVA